MAFAEIVGQATIVQTLQNALKTDRISHAYLFSGSRGTGKTSIARIMAKAVNCLDLKEGFEPCNKCSSCIEINQNKSMDLVEIDAASNRGIDEIRELKEGIRFSPIKAKYKVFIIDEVHMLTKEAFNALLKTLEEPPVYAVFILATTEVEKLPATIISRVQRFDFKRLGIKEIMQKIEMIAKSEKIKITEDALREIARAAEGSHRDAESLLDQLISLGYKEITVKIIEDVLGRINFKTVLQFLDFLADNNSLDAINLINKSYTQGIDPKEFSRACLKITRNIAVLKVSPETEKILSSDMAQEQITDIKNLAQKFSIEKIKKLLNEMIKIQDLIKHSPIPTLPLELIVMDLGDIN